MLSTRVASAFLMVLLVPVLGPDEPQSISLFDGKSLDGWKVSDFYKAPMVQVEEGAIVMPTGSPMSGVTCTRDDLFTTNYELSYEAKKIEGSDFFAAATFPVGKSHLTLVNGGWGGHLTGISSLNGADAANNETGHSVSYKTGVWYRFSIKVTDNVILYTIDDQEARRVEIEGRSVGVRTESGPSKPLGFSTYETKGAVKNIKIRKLAEAEIAAVSKTNDE